MSELNQLIDQWRAEFRSSEAMRIEDIAELEEHLRDSVDKLAGDGLSTEEAFLVARVRLGSPDVLSSEFGKTNTAAIWHRRIVWMLVGYVGLTAGKSLITSVGQIGATLASLYGSHPIAQAVVSAGLSLVIWAGVLFAMYRCASNGKSWFVSKVNRTSRPLLFICLAILPMGSWTVSILTTYLRHLQTTVETAGQIAIANSVSGIVTSWVMFACSIATIVVLRRRGKTTIV